MRYVANIGVILPVLQGFHYSPKADPFFVPELHVNAKGDYITQGFNSGLVVASSSPAQGGVPLGAGIAGGMIVGGILQASADDTQQKSRQFDATVRQRLPKLDMGAEFVAALKQGLEAKGVAVSVTRDAAAEAPRLRWARYNKDLMPVPADDLDRYPAVDADVLMQISPIAYYMAPGPLNAYRRNTTVCVALFNGRTKAFLGMQTFSFSGFNPGLAYNRYESLLEDLDNAAPGLRDSLLALVPKVVDVATGRAVD